MKTREDTNDEMGIETLREELTDFFGGGIFVIRPLSGGASVRRYYKITFREKSYFPRREIILMQIPSNHLEIAEDYLNISYYLRRHHIPPPRIFEIRREKGWIFMDIATGQPLNLLLREKPDQLESFYSDLVNFLLTIQKRARYEEHCPAFQRFFDAKKYQYEFQFHVHQQLIQNYFNYNLNFAESHVFDAFADEISHHLDSHQPVFVHRDFQSSNIFYDEANQEMPFQLIDFQDARSGSLTYDLVSLLWDSYVLLSQDLRERLVGYFYEKNKAVQNRYSFSDYLKNIDYTVIQRKLHDAGAFVYTSWLLGNNRFLNYIPGAIDMALQIMHKYQQFDAITNLFSKLKGRKDD
jgi:aminoglycoside/choline kinase family phosphotransferase